jgi:TRAP-type C4-dicarboxylate transport system permease small subunit
LKLVNLLDRVIAQAVQAAMMLLFTVMLGLSVTQIVLRYFFHTSIFWGDIVARQTVIWVGFFGAIFAVREDKHFKIDILTRFLGTRSRNWFIVFSYVFSAAICVLLAKSAITFITTGLETDTTGDSPVSLAFAASIIPIGFGLMAVQFLIRSIQSAHEALHPEAVADPPKTEHE